MPGLIENGYVYISMPPLYKLIINKKSQYIKTIEDLKKLIKGKTNYVIQRFKGLGEMDSEQLWETTMNPETRTLKRVNIEDVSNAERITVLLMGDKVPPRKEFIEIGSKNKKNPS